MPLILPARNKLIYPTGVATGFDPSHVASSAIEFSGVALGSNFYSILDGRKGALTGAPNAAFTEAGPMLSGFSATKYTMFSGHRTAVFTSQTYAAICVFTGLSGFQYLISGSSTSPGQALAVNSTTDLYYVRYGGSSWSSSVFTFATGVPYLIGVSTSETATTATFFSVNLKTGKSIFDTVAAGFGNNVASDGTIRIGAAPDATTPTQGHIAAAMQTNSFLDARGMSAWAADPWSFWYPQRRKFVIAPAASGSVGAATGTGAASGIAASTVAAVGAAVGTGAALGVAASTVAAVGAASGTGVASAIAASTVAGVGSATGTGAASGVAASTGAAVGAANGIGAASGVAASTVAAVGNAAGVGATDGQSIAGSVGAASGVGVALGVAASTVAAIGSASGTGSATGVAASTVAAIGAAAGIGTAIGIMADGSAPSIVPSPGGSISGGTFSRGRWRSLKEELRGEREVRERAIEAKRKTERKALEQAAAETAKARAIQRANEATRIAKAIQTQIEDDEEEEEAIALLLMH